MNAIDSIHRVHPNFSDFQPLHFLLIFVLQQHISHSASSVTLRYVQFTQFTNGALLEVVDVQIASEGIPVLAEEGIPVIALEFV